MAVPGAASLHVACSCHLGFCVMHGFCMWEPSQGVGSTVSFHRRNPGLKGQIKDSANEN